jgi:hypothetical protein
VDFILCPHFAHKRGTYDVIQTLRNCAQVIVKQVRIDVQGHYCGLVLKHILYGFDVGAGGHGQACSSVSKIMDRHRWEFRNAERALVPGAVLFGGRDQMLTEATWEHQLVFALSEYCRVDPFPQERGERHHPLLVCFRRADDDESLDEDRVLPDPESIFREVDVLGTTVKGCLAGCLTLGVAVGQHIAGLVRLGGGPEGSLSGTAGPVIGNDSESGISGYAGFSAEFGPLGAYSDDTLGLDGTSSSSTGLAMGGGVGCDAGIQGQWVFK